MEFPPFLLFGYCCFNKVESPLKIAILLLVSPLGFGLLAAQSEDPTLQALKSLPGFEKLLPKGRIAAISDPQFVKATEAQMPDDAWIIGVFDGTTAKAYDINLLNRHEIVNDFIGDKPIATTW